MLYAANVSFSNSLESSKPSFSTRIEQVSEQPSLAQQAVMSKTIQNERDRTDQRMNFPGQKKHSSFPLLSQLSPLNCLGYSSPSIRPEEDTFSLKLPQDASVPTPPFQKRMPQSPSKTSLMFAGSSQLQMYQASQPLIRPQPCMSGSGGNAHHSSFINQSMKSQTQSLCESGLQNSREDYWVKKVYQLMQDRRQVIQLLKDELKKKQQLIDKLNKLQMISKHRGIHHFQEFSDIISEEESMAGDLQNQMRKNASEKSQSQRSSVAVKSNEVKPVQPQGSNQAGIVTPESPTPNSSAKKCKESKVQDKLPQDNATAVQQWRTEAPIPEQKSSDYESSTQNHEEESSRKVELIRSPLGGSPQKLIAAEPLSHKVQILSADERRSSSVETRHNVFPQSETVIDDTEENKNKDPLQVNNSVCQPSVQLQNQTNTVNSGNQGSTQAQNQVQQVQLARASVIHGASHRKLMSHQDILAKQYTQSSVTLESKQIETQVKVSKAKDGRSTPINYNITGKKSANTLGGSLKKPQSQNKANNGDDMLVAAEETSSSQNRRETSSVYYGGSVINPSSPDSITTNRKNKQSFTTPYGAQSKPAAKASRGNRQPYRSLNVNAQLELQLQQKNTSTNQNAPSSSQQIQRPLSRSYQRKSPIVNSSPSLLAPKIPSINQLKPTKAKTSRSKQTCVLNYQKPSRPPSVKGTSNSGKRDYNSTACFKSSQQMIDLSEYQGFSESNHSESFNPVSQQRLIAQIGKKSPPQKATTPGNIGKASPQQSRLNMHAAHQPGKQKQAKTLFKKNKTMQNANGVINLATGSQKYHVRSSFGEMKSYLNGGEEHHSLKNQLPVSNRSNNSTRLASSTGNLQESKMGHH